MLAPAQPSTLQDELIDHAVGSIEAAELSDEPFPHLFFRDFFPRDFYLELIRSFPEVSFRPIAATDTHRTTVRIYGSHLQELPRELQSLWGAVSGMLASPQVERAIRCRLQAGLDIRARGDKVARAADLKMFAKPVIYRDTDGYQIKPHPDTRKKVVTMQLYCPDDDSQEKLGTTLYKFSPKGLLHPRSYCLEPVKSIPFLPNVGYAFVVLKSYHTLTQMSFHGRPKIATRKARVSILNTFYADANAEC